MERLLTPERLNTPAHDPVSPPAFEEPFIESCAPWLLRKVYPAAGTCWGDYDPSHLCCAPGFLGETVALYGHNLRAPSPHLPCNRALCASTAYAASFEMTLRPRTAQVAQALVAGHYFRSNWLRATCAPEDPTGSICLTSIPLPPECLLTESFFQGLCQGLIRDFEPNGPLSFKVSAFYLTNFHCSTELAAAIQLHQLYYALDSGTFYEKLFGHPTGPQCTSLADYTQRHAQELTQLRENRNAIGKTNYGAATTLTYPMLPACDEHTEWDLRFTQTHAFTFRRPVTTLEPERFLAISEFIYRLCKQIRYHDFFTATQEKQRFKLARTLAQKAHCHLLRQIASESL